MPGVYVNIKHFGDWIEKNGIGKKSKKSFFARNSKTILSLVALLLLSLIIFVLAVVYGPSNRIAPEPMISVEI